MSYYAVTAHRVRTAPPTRISTFCWKVGMTLASSKAAALAWGRAQRAVQSNDHLAARRLRVKGGRQERSEAIYHRSVFRQFGIGHPSPAGVGLL